MIAFIHMNFAGPFYRYRGWLFEFNPKKYDGPWPLNKDFNPRRTPPGRSFWKMWARWERLTPSPKKRTEVDW